MSSASHTSYIHRTQQHGAWKNSVATLYSCPSCYLTLMARVNDRMFGAGDTRCSALVLVNRNARLTAKEGKGEEEIGHRIERFRSATFTVVGTQHAEQVRHDRTNLQSSVLPTPFILDACRVRTYLSHFFSCNSSPCCPIDMGANHSQPKDRKEEPKARRSSTLLTLGKSPSRLNLFNLGKRSPQPPATPVTPVAVEPAAEPSIASPEASTADPEDRPEAAVFVSLPLFVRTGADCSLLCRLYFPSFSHLLYLYILNHQDEESDVALIMPQQPATVPCQVCLQNPL